MKKRTIFATLCGLAIVSAAMLGSSSIILSSGASNFGWGAFGGYREIGFLPDKTPIAHNRNASELSSPDMSNWGWGKFTGVQNVGFLPQKTTISDGGKGDTTMWLTTGQFYTGEGSADNPDVQFIGADFPQAFSSTPRVFAQWVPSSYNGMLFIAVISVSTTSVAFAIINIGSAGYQQLYVVACDNYITAP